EELSEQGYHASYVYCDAQMMEITKAQMELLEGRVPEKANEVLYSRNTFPKRELNIDLFEVFMELETRKLSKKAGY
ncbi:MAG: hypothetical protein HFG37_08180, partial [Eubacterium sp.]|nr:hypothetical protein [Eubacterium sp.]